MKTAREYASEYRELAKNLGLTGDSTELLVQMLAHFTYSSEVDQVAYANESSLERAIRPSSKIQLCVENCYSVYRGTCPKVVLRVNPVKTMTFKAGTKVVSGNTVSLWYLGRPRTDGTLDTSEFSVDPRTGPVTLMFLASLETIQRTWTVTEGNRYYVDCLEPDLAENPTVTVGRVGGTPGTIVKVTRDFGEHLRTDKVFDLTLPGWGSRLYLPAGLRVPSTAVTATYHRWAAEVPVPELAVLRVNGTEPVPEWPGAPGNAVPVAPGAWLLPGDPREDLRGVHYRSNADRWSAGVFRSNSDVGGLLQEFWPGRVKGTSFVYGTRTESSSPGGPSEVLIPASDHVLSGNTRQYSKGTKYVDLPGITAAGTLTVEVESTNAQDLGEPVYTIATGTGTIGPDRPVPAGVRFLVNGRPGNPGEYVMSVHWGTPGTSDNWTPVQGFVNPVIPEPSRPGQDLWIQVHSLATGVGLWPVTQHVIPWVEPGTTSWFGYPESTVTTWSPEVTCTPVMYESGALVVPVSAELLSKPGPGLSVTVSPGGVVTAKVLELTKGPWDLVIQATGPSGTKSIGLLTVRSGYTEATVPRRLQVIGRTPGGLYLDRVPTEIAVWPGETYTFRDLPVPTNLRADRVGLSLHAAKGHEIKVGRVMWEPDNRGQGSVGDTQTTIWYVPVDPENPLSESEVAEFLEARRNYYVTDDLRVRPGSRVKALVGISARTSSEANLGPEITEILSGYSGRFGIDTGTVQGDIVAQITKLPGVARVTGCTIEYRTATGELLRESDIDPRTTYFEFRHTLITDTQ
mgnify:CR=1 FL=1